MIGCKTEHLAFPLPSFMCPGRSLLQNTSPDHALTWLWARATFLAREVRMEKEIEAFRKQVVR